ncbi:DNA glycosylase AlkZ-like family protein [Nocardia sp. NPDC049149]|uniref:DNA glycosylase AlkZ-like family protein n=1 Tax=Nocardia sp. NPDC049149 TaxID=3364315 RepID=UPI0037205576
MRLDKKYHRAVWKTVGEPGTVLADGKIVGIWRPRKSGRTVTLTVSTFGALSADLRKQVRADAEKVAELRGGATVQVDFDKL